MTGKLRAGIRMVVSQSNKTVVPASQTDRDCVIEFDGALEYSGLWFDEFRLCLALTGMIAQWVDAHYSDQSVYAIFEAASRPMRRIYLQSLALEEVNHPHIAYDGFTYKDSGQAVEWQLVVCRPESRMARSFRYLNVAGASLDQYCHVA
jgi:hypothetical protein